MVHRKSKPVNYLATRRPVKVRGQTGRAGRKIRYNTNTDTEDGDEEEEIETGVSNSGNRRFSMVGSPTYLKLVPLYDIYSATRTWILDTPLTQVDNPVVWRHP